ncbi:hypothetical protein CWI37_0521p0010 [Hamiltosporidium tvaerminnensis]|uniref:Uncharacterized protein n=3 Tax=Hamiltosporidium TaxID=1176354 RepID=A0A4Q9L546_9MICR|nr:hypothetical protein CWI37_0521p0010 [Hamiltosporidium tvaerminnensis]
MHMRISYNDITADNSEVKESINEILKAINCKDKYQMLKKELHPFLRHFTTLNCCIFYNDCSEEYLKAYQPELLFNLICFGKFVEMYKENEEYKDIVQKIFKDFLLDKINRFSYKNLDYLIPSYEALTPDISRSFNKRDETDLEVLKKFKIVFDENSKPSPLKDILSNATFEQFFFFPVNLNESAKNIIETATILSTNMNNVFNDQQYKMVLKFISEKIVAKVLKNQNGFDEIFELDKNISNFQNKPEDPNFPHVFIELLCNETDVIFIKTLYEFLIEKTKEEYHNYISAVLCLKALCLGEEILNKKNISRIIIEFLFLVDVLKTESRKNENIEILKKYRKERIDSFKQIFDQKKIDYVKKEDGNYLNCNKVPKTTVLIEIYCFVEFFSNDSFKTFLDNQINEKMTKEKNKIFANNSKIKESYFKYIFENELSTLTSEDRKLRFCPPESANPDPESKK